jgi:hypothetical protein
MSKVTEHFTEHLFAWMTTAILGLASLGALAYMDTRHIQRAEHKAQMLQQKVVRVEDQIDEIDLDINEKDFYNQFGSAGNKDARLRIIAEQKTRKTKKIREWEKLTGADYKRE